MQKPDPSVWERRAGQGIGSLSHTWKDQKGQRCLAQPSPGNLRPVCLTRAWICCLTSKVKTMAVVASGGRHRNCLISWKLCRTCRGACFMLMHGMQILGCSICSMPTCPLKISNQQTTTATLPCKAHICCQRASKAESKDQQQHSTRFHASTKDTSSANDQENLNCAA